MSGLGDKLSQRRKARLSLAVLALLVIVGVAARFLISADVFSPTLKYYVAENGSDTNPGTIDAPFATIQQARNVLRDKSVSPDFPGADVLIRGGEYDVTSMIELTNVDSGQPGKTISYKNYPNEKPVIKGGRVLSGWTAIGDGKYQITLPADVSDKKLGELYLNDQKQLLAQAPNPVKLPPYDYSQDDPYAGNWFFASLDNSTYNPNTGIWSCTDTTKKVLIYDYKTNEDIPQAFADSINLATLQPTKNKPQVDIFPRYDWSNNIVDIAGVDAATKKITTIQEMGSSSSYVCAKNRYLVKNFSAALDSPTEWYQDMTANTLTYMPPKELTSDDVVRASLNEISNRAFNITNAHDIKIEGLTFEEFGSDVIRLNYSDNVTIDSNIIHSSMSYGINITAATSQNSFYNNIHHNEIYDVGRAGISIAPLTTYSYALDADNTQITDNIIHDISYLYHGDAAIALYYSVGGNISHNRVYNVPRIGIKISSNDTVVSYNDIQNICLMTQDCAAIYHTGRMHNRGNIIDHNYIKKTNGYGKYNFGTADAPMKFGFGTLGIYFDLATGGDTITDNIIIDGSRGCLDNNGGSYNTWLNNVCVNTGTDEGYGTQILMKENSSKYIEYQAELRAAIDAATGTKYTLDLNAYKKYPGLEDIYRSEPAAMSDGDFMINNTFQHNIFYNPTTPTRTAFDVSYLGVSQSIDKNLYFFGIDNLPIIESRTHIESQGKIIDHDSVVSWADWKLDPFNFDVNSVHADPKFADVAAENFNVATDSPALGLGFTNINTEGIGPRPVDLPLITITYPANNTEINENSITVEYTVDGESKSRLFSDLSEGTNTLTVSATSPVDSGRVASATVTVIYTKPSPPADNGDYVYLSPDAFSNGWDMVSFPNIENGLSLNNLLPSTFKIRKFDNAGNNFLKGESNAITAQPGTGYWIKSDDVSKVANVKYPMVATSSASVPVSKGWNLLGNPFASNMPISKLSVTYKNGVTRSFSSAVSRGEVAGYAWSWETKPTKQYFFISANPNNYKTSAQKSTYVSANRGFWFYVSSSQVSSITMNK